jgi:hypothetical protein
MRVITGRVVGGRIDFETDLEEGTPVAVIAAERAGFQLTAEDEEELLLAFQDIESGNFEDGDELLREIRGLSRR